FAAIVHHRPKVNGRGQIPSERRLPSNRGWPLRTGIAAPCAGFVQILDVFSKAYSARGSLPPYGQERSDNVLSTTSLPSKAALIRVPFPPIPVPQQVLPLAREVVRQRRN